MKMLQVTIMAPIIVQLKSRFFQLTLDAKKKSKLNFYNRPIDFLTLSEMLRVRKKFTND